MYTMPKYIYGGFPSFLNIHCTCRFHIIGILNQRFDYAVQIHPVIFLTQPQSQVVHENQTVTLSCQARVAHIVDRTYPLPTISWRYNGITLNTADSSKTIISNVPTGHSQLIIHNVSNYDTGQYRCVANDANGKYITISEPAYLTVLHTSKYIITSTCI